MKPSLQFSVPCLDLENANGKPPVFKTVFFELPFPELPGKLVYFYILNGWCSGQGRFIQSMRIINPSGHCLVNTGDQPVELSSPNVPMMIVNRLEDISFEEIGPHKVQIFLDGEKVLEYPITIRRVLSK